MKRKLGCPNNLLEHEEPVESLRSALQGLKMEGEAWWRLALAVVQKVGLESADNERPCQNTRCTFTGTCCNGSHLEDRWMHVSTCLTPQCLHPGPLDAHPLPASPSALTQLFKATRTCHKKISSCR